MQSRNYIRIRFQSTHSQGVRCTLLWLIDRITDISIHALTRSAILSLLTSYLNASYFNPRTHKECDSICRSSIVQI